jgi:hypothetical protein
MQGPQTITDSFASDGYYQSASNTQQALTFTYISGTFALGDVTVKNATTVTWWGSQWHRSSPPATVPAYMAVAVPSHVTKAGSTIRGAIPQVVIVKTNPGYAPDPSNPGTGTIVATLCP